MRVQLEAVEARHLTWLKNLRNDPAVMDFCRQPYLLTSQNQDDWYKQICKNRDMIPFIVSDEDLPQAEQWIGYAALSHIDPIADKAECSYVIDPKHRDKGYGQQAIFQLLYYGFYCLGLQKIYSDTFDYNQKEIEINKGCGFVEVGHNPRHYFKRGSLIGSVSMYILREKFDAVWAEPLKLIFKPESKPL